MDDQPKLIIDEDWKSQVQAEKETLAKAAPPQGAAVPGGPCTAAVPHAQPAGLGPSPTEEAGEHIPPASLTMLAMSLATQAMVALGQVPHPLTNRPELDLEHASHLVDTLHVLEDKTQGNLTPDEAALLGNLLHELRLAFIAARSRAQQRGAGPAGSA